MRAIITCECSDTESFAKDAFRILFPGQELPEVIPQTQQNVDFVKWAPYVQAAQKSEEKYAYYLADDEMWDLLKGVRLA